MEDYGRWIVTTPPIFTLAGLDGSRPRYPRRLGARRVAEANPAPPSCEPAQRRTAKRSRTAVNPDIDQWPVSRFTCPSIVHGTRDENTSYTRSVEFAKRDAQAKLVSIEVATTSFRSRDRKS